jgi:hypothetical protein
MVKLFYQLRALGASGERTHIFDDITCNQLLTTDAQLLVDDELAQVHQLRVGAHNIHMVQSATLTTPFTLPVFHEDMAGYSHVLAAVAQQHEQQPSTTGHGPVHALIINYFVNIRKSDGEQLTANLNTNNITTTQECMDARQLLYSLLVAYNNGNVAGVNSTMALFDRTLLNLQAAYDEHIYPAVVQWLKHNDNSILLAFEQANISLYL